MSARGPGPIPNRWLHCPRKSETIIAEHFLAFKTPLSLAYKDQMPIECVFTPEMIFGYIKTLKLKLGLWIDLTNTKRFYDRDVVDARSAQYVKLQCRGHGETPSAEQTRSFIEIVDEFIAERPYDVIGVHCTHGFNRTGFLIVSYMVERLDYSVKTALTLFAKARPPGIYKQDYINELFRRYEDEEMTAPAPDLPAWCLEYDDSDGNSSGVGQKRKYDEVAHTSNSLQTHASTSQQFRNGVEDLDDDDQVDESDGIAATNSGDAAATSNGKPRKKRRRELQVKNPTFMAGVPGVDVVTDQPRLGDLQQKVQKMVGSPNNGFAGAQPVSMDCNNIHLLRDKPYRVSWKADGTRYMMLIKKRNEIYFLDRNNSCFQVRNMTFVKAGNLKEHLKDTLLDGEMVLDKFEGKIMPRYLIYDIVKISGNDIGIQPFYKDRLDCIKKEIIDPRCEAIHKGIINRPMEPFSVRNKEFWDIRQSESLLGEKFAKCLLHEPDGLIFQPSDSPYTPGACPDVLKWKPSDMNSVDFRLKIAMESGQGIVSQKVGFLYVGGKELPFSKIKCTRTIKELDNKIVECTLNSQGQWEFMRERTDKVLPNGYDTAMAVCNSIRYPITREILLNYIANHGFQDSKDLMPPPAMQQKQRRPPPPPSPHQQQQSRQPH